MQRKSQLPMHECYEVKYGSKTKLAPKEDTSKPLNDERICWVQTILGTLLWIGRAMNSKLVVAQSALGPQQASSTEDTNKVIHQLLDYCATYPDDGILYRSINMILTRHSDAGFNNETRKKIWAGAHILFLKTNPFLIGMDIF